MTHMHKIYRVFKSFEPVPVSEPVLVSGGSGEMQKRDSETKR